jgi:alpha-1,6-mannosyltransferase
VIAVLGVGLIAVSLPSLARRSGVPLGRAVWLALACPLIPIHLISGAHNDALMVGFVVAALALAADRRVLLAGLLFGLAVGVKATAVVAVPFAVLLALRPTLWTTEEKRQTPVVSSSPPETGWGRLGILRADRKLLFRASGELLLGMIGVLVVVTIFSGRGLGWFKGLVGSGVSVQWTSPPTAVGMTLELAGLHAVPITRAIGIAALVVVLVWLWWRARRAEPLLYAGLALAATVVLAPVLAALCLPDGYNLALATKSQGAILMTVFLIVLIGKALHDTKNRDRRVAGPDHHSDRLSRRDA